MLLDEWPRVKQLTSAASGGDDGGGSSTQTSARCGCGGRVALCCAASVKPYRNVRKLLVKSFSLGIELESTATSLRYSAVMNDSGSKTSSSRSQRAKTRQSRRRPSSSRSQRATKRQSRRRPSSSRSQRANKRQSRRRPSSSRSQRNQARYMWPDVGRAGTIDATRTMHKNTSVIGATNVYCRLSP